MSVLNYELTIRDSKNPERPLTERSSSSYSETTSQTILVANGASDLQLNFGGVVTSDILYMKSDQNLTVNFNASTGTNITLAANKPFFLSGTAVTALYVTNSSGSTATLEWKIWETGSTSSTTISSSIFNIRDYGALGAGTDDTDAMQDAIDAAYFDGSRNQGIVYIPAGNYGFTELTIHLGQVIIGQGIRQSVLTRLGVGSGGPAISVGAGATDGAQAVRLIGFKVNGANIGTDLDGINLTDTYTNFAIGGSLQDLWVVNCTGYGVRLVSNVSEVRNIFLQGSKVNLYVTGGAFYGYNISAEGATNEDCIINALGSYIFGLQLESASTTTSDALVDIVSVGNGSVNIHGIWANYAGHTRRSIVHMGASGTDCVLTGLTYGGGTFTNAIHDASFDPARTVAIPTLNTAISSYSNAHGTLQRPVHQVLTIQDLLSPTAVVGTLAFNGDAPASTATPVIWAESNNLLLNHNTEFQVRKANTEQFGVSDLGVNISMTNLNLVAGDKYLNFNGATDTTDPRIWNETDNLILNHNNVLAIRKDNANEVTFDGVDVNFTDEIKFVAGNHYIKFNASTDTTTPRIWNETNNLILNHNDTFAIRKNNTNHFTLSATGVADFVNTLTSLTRNVTKTQANSPYTLSGSDLRKTLLNNNGASGSCTFNLPEASVGMSTGFYVIAAQTMVVHPFTGDQIMVITGAPNTDVTLAATRGTYLTLLCVLANQWEPVGQNGTIT